MPWILRKTLLIALLMLPIIFYIVLRLKTSILRIFNSMGLKVSKKVLRISIFSFLLWIYILPISILGYFFINRLNLLFLYKPVLQWQDYLFLYPFWIGIIAILEITPYFIFLDLMSGVSRILKLNKKIWFDFLKLFVFFFFLIYAGIRSHIDTHHVRVSQTSLTIENLPPQLKGLKICLVGDLHVDRYTQEEKLLVVKDTLNSSEADLVLFSGDLIARGFNYYDQAIETVSHAKGKLANIACMGDHDYWTAAKIVPRDMRNQGWVFLEDNHHLILYKKKKILVTGVTHVYSQKISKGKLELLFQNAPTADLKILLVHQPREMIVETASKYGYHLVLAGHTHGGQIISHIFGMPISVGQEETRFWRGHYQIKKTHVIITNGIGLTLAALRYHAPSELNMIRFQ